MSMSDKLIEAFRSAGLEPPKKQAQPVKAKKSSKARSYHRYQSDNMGLKFPSKPATQGKTKIPVAGGVEKGLPAKSIKPKSIPGKPIVIRIKHDNVNTSPKPHSVKSSAIKTVPFSAQFSMELLPGAAVNEFEFTNAAKLKFLTFAADGSKTQSDSHEFGTERIPHELTIGIDFGTSSVKVIIGDRVLNQALAVPFFDSVGVSQYLLPSRLYTEGKTWSLNNGAKYIADLKMKLMNSPNDRAFRAATALFLALVIRHCRSWLFDTHFNTYSKFNIHWSLAVGIPSNEVDTEIANSYKVLSAAAWVLAEYPSESLTAQQASKLVEELSELESKKFLKRCEGFELIVVPEIAAQVYGYVTSDGFDPNAQKVFLMCDVGAGTVDAALFRPVKKRGKVNFTFYTTSVKALGVVNLHVNRLKWLSEALKAKGEVASKLKNEILSKLESKNWFITVPKSIKEYIKNMKLSFGSIDYDPDVQFYKKVKGQVKNDVFWKAWDDELWDQSDLKDTPFYLCGGGSRVKLYEQLKNDVSVTANKTWLSAKYRPLPKPENLVAKGLGKENYDRLSVAYGLGYGNVGDVVKDLEKHVRKIPIPTYTDNYVSKDQV